MRSSLVFLFIYILYIIFIYLGIRIYYVSNVSALCMLWAGQLLYLQLIYSISLCHIL
jgi:hypothetical protein